MIDNLSFLKKAKGILKLESILERYHKQGRFSEAEYFHRKDQIINNLNALKAMHTEFIDSYLMEIVRGRQDLDRMVGHGDMREEQYQELNQKIEGERLDLIDERNKVSALDTLGYLAFLQKNVDYEEHVEESEADKFRHSLSSAMPHYTHLLGVTLILILMLFYFTPWDWVMNEVAIDMDAFSTSLPGMSYEATSSTIFKPATSSVFVVTSTSLTVETTSVGSVTVGDTTSTTTLKTVSLPASVHSHFGFMHPQDAYSEASTLDVSWERPHEGPFIWGGIETQENHFDWSEPDEYVLKSQDHGFNILATIWPFADWDQEKCHSEADCMGFGFNGEGELPSLRCKPCDMNAYLLFVKALVERYDGDGVADMPGLLHPIKYWEAGNEPELQGAELTFFKGSPSDYFEVLKITYGGVKEADSESSVLHAGFAGLGDESRSFWRQVFEMGGDRYFDVANIHSIGGDDEHLYVDDMSKFLREHGVHSPIWVSEAQYNGGDGHEGRDEFARLMVRSFVYAFGNGAEKIFYVGLTTPTPGHENAALLNRFGTKTHVYTAYSTLVSKLDYFSTVKKIREDQYTFIVKGRSVWVLWGDNKPPSEITGEVKVTSVDGKSKKMRAPDITLSESPVFVEKA